MCQLTLKIIYQIQILVRRIIYLWTKNQQDLREQIQVLLLWSKKTPIACKRQIIHRHLGSMAHQLEWSHLMSAADARTLVHSVLYSQIYFTMVQVTAKNKRLITHQSPVVSTVMDSGSFLAGNINHRTPLDIVVLDQFQLVRAKEPLFQKMQIPRAILVSKLKNKVKVAIVALH